MTILDFDDYRKFIKSSIQQQPNNGWGMNNSLAARIRISPAQMSQVLTGKKNLTIEQAHLLGKALSFNDDNLEYFIALVEKERAGTANLKDYYEQKIKKLKRSLLKVKSLVPSHVTLTEENKSRFYSDWTYSAIRLYCSIGSGKTFEQIMKFTHLDAVSLTNKLEFLVGSGLCEENSGKICMKTQRTFVERGSTHFLQHYANWRAVGLEQSKRLAHQNENSIFFTSPVSMGENDFDSFSEELRKLIQTFSSKVEKSNPESVACLNIDFFKLT